MKFVKNILSGICILAFLSSGMLTVVAQDSADLARSYAQWRYYNVRVS